MTPIERTIMDIQKVVSIETAIDFFNEEIAGEIVTTTGKILTTPPIK